MKNLHTIANRFLRKRSPKASTPQYFCWLTFLGKSLVQNSPAVSKNMNSARTLNCKKGILNVRFCLISNDFAENTHLSRLVIMVENLKYNFRNRLKAQWLDSFGELNWSEMYYMYDLSMVYEEHEFIPLQSNTGGRDSKF